MTFPKLHYLVKWIQKREEARRGYETRAKKPWTDDPVIQSYRFCNVQRQHDKVTKWLNENWYPNWGNENFPAAITLARLFNQPRTLEAIGYPGCWDLDRMHDVVQKRFDKGEKVFNAAYIVSTNGKPGSKIKYVLRMADDVRRLGLLPTNSLKAVYDKLRTVEGLGKGFLAGQVIADLKYTQPWVKAIDWWTWCSPGPGSLRGLNRICDQDPDTRWAERTFVLYVGMLRTLIEQETKLQLHAQDVQNCLCEVDKYMRALEGGRPKQLYPGR